MKTAAIIAEYNPFHMGHAKQLQDIKQLYHVDTCLILMSGNFVQRGTPAIINKFIRTKWALQNGADIVLELPTAFATAGAEQFAYGACSILNRLEFIDILCFGSELPSVQLINTIAEFLLNPPVSFHEKIQESLHLGNSYAVAREEALYSILMEIPDFYKQFYTLFSKTSSDRKAFHSLLSAPNNILGIEYCKALKKINSTIKPVAMPRIGSAYHNMSLPTLSSKDSSCFAASASAIRHHLFHCPNDLTPLSAFVPKEALNDLSSSPLLHENDFSSYLYYALLGKNPEELMQYYEVSLELARRIYKKFPEFQNFSSFVEKLKTKQYTYARIQRALLHILLSIQKEEPLEEVNFLRLLGLKKERSHLLRSISKQTRSILITKAADASKKLSAYDRKQFEKEITRSQLYGFTASQPDMPPYRELSISPVIL